MASKIKNAPSVNTAQAHFMKAPVGEIEFSRFNSMPSTITTFNAGKLIPIACGSSAALEVLPHDSLSLSLPNIIIRQNTMAVPVMDDLFIDVYAFWCPYRILNESFVNVMGENSSGSWTAPEVDLAPLVHTPNGSTSIPSESIADYFGFPTQQPISNALLFRCNDLWARAYLEVWNTYFRDENYQPPYPYSKLNVCNRFLRALDDPTRSVSLNVPSFQPSDGSNPAGAITKALSGEGSVTRESQNVSVGLSGYSMLDEPLDVCKMHDYFTSVLPSPQKSEEIVVGLTNDILPLRSFNTLTQLKVPGSSESGFSGMLALSTNQLLTSQFTSLGLLGSTGGTYTSKLALADSSSDTSSNSSNIVGTNLGIPGSDVAISINDLRNSVVVQQCAELLARSGSRYKEYISAAFGLEIDDQYADKPVLLGHFRRKLDVYQTAQTSASGDTPQGNLAAFSYTSTGGDLIKAKTFVEHGCVLTLACIRQANTYPSQLSKSFFRRSRLDWYQPLLANISEQPVYTYELNPFTPNLDQVWGYQEAFCEYRLFPNSCTGYMRKGTDDSLANWTYSDPFNSALTVSTGDWLKSNAAEVIRPTLAAEESIVSQFKAKITFNIDFQRPMPVYSVPGLDIF